MPHAFDPFATVMSAIANASRVPVSADAIRAMLTTGGGEPTHVRALFSDVDLATLMRIAIAEEIPTRTMVAAYRRARTIGAANAELDALAKEFAEP